MADDILLRILPIKVTITTSHGSIDGVQELKRLRIEPQLFNISLPHHTTGITSIRACFNVLRCLVINNAVVS